MKAIAIALVLAIAPNVAAAAGWFLVLVEQGGPDTLVIIPEKYPARHECMRAGRAWKRADPNYDRGIL